MLPQRLEEFVTGLEFLRGLLDRLFVSRRVVQYRGMAPWLKRFVIAEDRAALRDVVDSFQLAISQYEGLAREVDPELCEAMQDILERSFLRKAIVKLGFQLRAAEHVEPIPSGDEIVYGLLWLLASQKTKTKYADTLSLGKTYGPLDQLITLLKQLDQAVREPAVYDDAIFAPSRLNVTFVVNLLDQASGELRGSLIEEESKRQLLAYIEEARRELKRPRPSWGKVIGALVITATLISGTADLPKAVETLQEAVRYIMDTAKVPVKSLPPGELSDHHDDGETDDQQF